MLAFLAGSSCARRPLIDVVTVLAALSVLVTGVVAQDCLPYGISVRTLPAGETIDMAYAVAGEADIIYVAAGAEGLLVFQIPESGALVRLAELDLPGAAYDVALHGTYLLVTGGTGGLHVVDVSVPVAPVLTTSLATPGNDARELEVVGDEAYLFGTNWGCEGEGSDLVRVDISNPATPVLLGSHSVGAYATAMDRSGNLIAIGISEYWWEQLGPNWFECIGHASLRLLDASDPASPAVLAVEDLYELPAGVAILGDHLYMAGDDVTVYDVVNPAVPILVTSLDLAEPAQDLLRVADLLYVTTQSGGVVVVDTNDPAAPFISASFQMPIICDRVAVAGEYLVGAGGEDGICAVHIGDPVAPAFPTADTVALGHLALAQPASVQATAGDVVYACGQQITVIDAADPAAPTAIATIPSGMLATIDAVVAGDVLVVNGVNSSFLLGVQTFDVSTPGDPQFLGQLITAAGELVVVDATTVINNVNNQLNILEVSAPGGPQLVGTFVDLYQVWGVAYQDGWLYLVGNRSEGQPVLAVYTAGDPVSPVLVTEIELTEEFVGITVDGPRIYLSNWSTATVVEITDPAVPVVGGSAPVLDYHQDWTAVDDGLFYLSGEEYLQAYEVSGENELTLLGLQSLGFQSLGMSGLGVFDHNLLALTGSDFYVVPPACHETVGVIAPPDGDSQTPPSAAVRLVGGQPNPFNPKTEIVFELDVPQHVTIGIYDVVGREVVRLVTGVIPAGRHDVPWDGRDASGAAVASGAYFVRMETARSVQVTKLSLVR